MFAVAARSSSPANVANVANPSPHSFAPLRPMPVSSSHLSHDSLQGLLVGDSSEAAPDEDGYATDDTGEC